MPGRGVKEEVGLADGLLRAAVAFTDTLREAGLPVGLSRTIAFLRALGELDPTQKQQFYWAARLTLCSRHADLEVFDEVFENFWVRQLSGQQPRVASAPDKPAPEPPQPSASPPAATTPGPMVAIAERDSSGEEPESDREQIAGVFRYSPEEALRHKDFASYTPDEFEAAQRLMATIRLAAPLRRARRLARARRGLLAFGPTLRRAFRTQGEPLRWVWQAPKLKPRRIVFICDVSGSMSDYSRALLLFLHTAVCARRDIEAFCFGTRLTRVTKELSSRDPEKSLARAAAAILDWSGGTRLGECLKTFIDLWGQRGVAHGAIVVIMSDGWDRGDPALLAQQMARLRRLCHLLIWVNPCKGDPSYEPLTLGMATALPYLDDFLAGHNLASLHSLADIISEAFERRAIA